jgi:MOSC domain-containing protein YiiM
MHSGAAGPEGTAPGRSPHPQEAGTETGQPGTLEAVGRVERIWVKRFRRGPMDAVSEAELVAGRGIAGNANQGGRRQVTLIQQEAWQELMHGLGADLDPATRRANLMISGVRLKKTRGKMLYIGTSRLEIWGETKPCERMEESLTGLKSAMYPDWRGGVFATVSVGGIIRVGDRVELHETGEQGRLL